MDRYRVNDILAELADEAGVKVEEDALDDLTHHVADALGIDMPGASR